MVYSVKCFALQRISEDETVFEKDMRLTLLLDYYGDLLSEQRRSVMELYYCEDLSLSEIAENTGITRQAVRDSIKKGETELHRIDEALNLVNRMQTIQDRCSAASDQLKEILGEIPKGDIHTSLSDLLESIEAILN